MMDDIKKTVSTTHELMQYNPQKHNDETMLGNISLGFRWGGLLSRSYPMHIPVIIVYGCPEIKPTGLETLQVLGESPQLLHGFV